MYVYQHALCSIVVEFLRNMHFDVKSALPGLIFKLGFNYEIV